MIIEQVYILWALHSPALPRAEKFWCVEEKQTSSEAVCVHTPACGMQARDEDFSLPDNRLFLRKISGNAAIAAKLIGML